MKMGKLIYRQTTVRGRRANLGNSQDQKMAGQKTGEDDAVQQRHRARIQELKGKGYPNWHAESQAMSELRIEPGG
jgi:hypothetical protein